MSHKRIFDIVICLVVATPAMIIAVIFLPLIYLETKASPVFRQNRVGRNGKTFSMLKLRTMFATTPDRASHEIDINSITAIGKFLRRAKIDELPQLWNVLMGDMSLVGPRPCLPSQIELIEERARVGVLHLRPGITGIAQLAGLDMSQPRALAHADAEYLRPWSLRKDLRLLIQTATGKGSGDAAAAA